MRFSKSKSMRDEQFQRVGFSTTGCAHMQLSVFQVLETQDLTSAIASIRGRFTLYPWSMPPCLSNGHCKTASRPPTGAWIEDQPAWFRRRALCAFQADQGACLRAANRERESVLAAVARPADEALRPARCVVGGRRQALHLLLRDETVAAYSDEGLVWFARAGTTAWTPFTATVPGRRLVIQRSDGARLSCQVAR